jgi:uncharacterized membrane protein
MMRRILLVLPLLLAGACQTSSRPYAPVENVRYTAIGQEPFWMVTIGDDAIVLSSAPEPGTREQRLRSYRYPRTLPRTVDGVRTWQSGDGTAVISVEAMPGPCEGSRGARYRDRVRVRLSGREMFGCGGPRLGRRG